MRYMLLIYDDETEFEKMAPEEVGALMEVWGKFHAELAESGCMQVSDRLQPTPTATTVRVRNGETLSTDGPFAETKEQLGGLYVIDVPDLDAALAWAAKIPSAEFGSIEVRPIWEAEDM